VRNADNGPIAILIEIDPHGAQGAAVLQSQFVASIEPFLTAKLHSIDPPDASS
jgi:hypothetical protein